MWKETAEINEIEETIEKAGKKKMSSLKRLLKLNFLVRLIKKKRKYKL